MSKGVILFAFNSPKFNYYDMAVATAKRINHFLNLPVTLVTDETSIPTDPNYVFDKTITVTPDKNNKRDWGIWINKGRYQAYELSPYDETILLDTDYLVNSNKLLYCNGMLLYEEESSGDGLIGEYYDNESWLGSYKIRKC